ncbi:MAG: hypothetical protein EXQ69_06655 [Acidimicrobiia bacterium]|nr:hypothetical protein [Acidimicrobiia bacterium]
MSMATSAAKHDSRLHLYRR